MPTFVKGTALTVGDVIQDQQNIGDTHPYVVIATSQFKITLRNCTSHETSALELIKILKADKTGDPEWSGKDSFVVKSGLTTDLNTYRDDSFYQQELVPVVVGPPVPMQFLGEQGPYIAYVSPTQIVSVPRLIQRYSDILYRKIGTIQTSRMTTLLTELNG